VMLYQLSYVRVGNHPTNQQSIMHLVALEDL